MLHYRIIFLGKILLLFLLLISTVVLRKAFAQLTCSSYSSGQTKNDLITSSSTQNQNSQYLPGKSKKSLTHYKTEKSKPFDQVWPEGKWGIGTFYKYGSFSGSLATVFTNYQVFKPLYMDCRLERIYFDLGFSLFCQLGEIKQATVGGNTYPGAFYGQFTEGYASAGFSVYRNRSFDILPTLAFSYLEYNVYPMKRKIFDRKVPFIISRPYQNLDESTSYILGWGPGVFVDFRLFNFLIDNEVSDVSIRARYNAFLFTKDKLYAQKGVMHELSTEVSHF